MKKILVTGGAGFLGSNLCARLVNEGNYVICLDNFLTGRVENIRELLNKENFEFIEWDVQKPITLEADEIYNSACPASPPAYQASPVNTVKTCVIGLLNMLELARSCNAKLLQFSTSEVYGEPLSHPQAEGYRGNVNPVGIRACYDEGKRCAEALCFDHHREFGTRVKIIRIFNTYGRHMAPDDGRVISNFIVQALRGEDITIYGNGTQTRSFCYVDDLIEGIIRMMNSRDDFMGPVNLGNPAEYTILYLATKVLERIKTGSRIVHKPVPQDDPTRRRPDITLAGKELGWAPGISLEEGLDRTIAYFAERI